MKVRYNAPVVLTFALLSTAVLVVDGVTGGRLMPQLALGGTMNVTSVQDWVRMVTYVLGHAGLGHLMSNMMLLLLIGPMLEEKFGARRLLLMIMATALITGALNLLFFSSGLIGASGIVFMFIVLASATNVRNGEVPLTFVLVVALYLGQEVVIGLRDDGISQFAHIMGGLCGAGFGLLPRGANK